MLQGCDAHFARLAENQTFSTTSSIRPSIFQGAKTGKDNGYTMLFDIEAFDYSYYDEGSEGLKVKSASITTNQTQTKRSITTEYSVVVQPLTNRTTLSEGGAASPPRHAHHAADGLPHRPGDGEPGTLDTGRVVQGVLEKVLFNVCTY